MAATKGRICAELQDDRVLSGSAVSGGRLWPHPLTSAIVLVWAEPQQELAFRDVDQWGITASILLCHVPA